MNFDNYTQTDSSGLERTSDGFKKGMEKAGRMGFNAGRKGIGKVKKLTKRKGNDALKLAEKFLRKIFSKKTVIILTIGIFLALFLIISCYSCGYTIIGVDDGEKGNYVEDGNPSDKTSSGEGDSEGMLLTVSNQACISYYTLLSKEKSCWQEKIGEDGEVELIQYGSPDAVSDAFGNDKNYFVNPNLLFAMNKYLYDNDYVLPEVFLKPVAYKKDSDGKYQLESLTDKNGNVQVKSYQYESNGKKTDFKEKSISDYGLGSVLIYEEKPKNTVLKGTYIKEDYLDKASGTVMQREISEDFSIDLSSDTDTVIKTAITFAGVIDFTYETDQTLTEKVKEEESDNERDNVEKIEYKKVTTTTYIANGPGGAVRYFTSTSDMEEFVNKYPKFTPAKDSKGKYKTEKREISLYKYRDKNSGVHVSFVKKKTAKVRGETTKYLYDYLQNFETYKPIMTRTNDTFRSFDSDINVGMLETASLQSSEVGTGDNAFEQLYSGSKKAVIEEIWDGLINYGFTKEQTAAILGNITQESGFITDAEDDTGAFGLVQFMGSRKDKLFAFSKSYNKKEIPDIRSQVQFIAMEVLGGGKWCDDAWTGHQKDKEIFFTSTSIEEITKAFCDGYERPADAYAMIPKRQRCAKSAYMLLNSREVKKDASFMVNDNKVNQSGTLVQSNALSEEEQEVFNEFYHMADDIYGGKYTLEYYRRKLTRTEAELVIKTASSYINQTSINKVNLEDEKQMWCETYLSDLAKKDIEYSGIKDGEADIFVAKKGEFIPPLTRIIVTDEFGNREAPVAGASTYHQGIDLAASYGEPVRASKDGVVVTAEWGASGGNYVIINHGEDKNGDTISTMYLHNSRLCVKVGDKVKQGQKIAEAGSTGYSTGPHCHFSVLVNGVPVNPRKYVNFN